MIHTEKTMMTETALPAEWRESEPGGNIGRLVGQARAQFMAGLDEALHERGLTSMQWIAFKLIASGQCKTAVDLCRTVSYDTGSMTRILDKLETSGLIQRQRSTEDRRVVHLSVAPYGQRQIPALMKVGEAITERYLRGFTPAEIKQLQTYLLRILHNGDSRNPHGENAAMATERANKT